MTLVGVRSSLATFWGTVCRKKTITEDFHETPLKKCLTTFDMTLLGVGQMVGAGIYVLTGITYANFNRNYVFAIGTPQAIL